MLVADKNLLDEFMYFLVQRPSAQEILDYKASPEQEERLNILVEKSKAEKLGSDEEKELEDIFRANHYAAMFKLRALKELKEAA